MELFFMMQIHWIISTATCIKPINLVKDYNKRKSLYKKNNKLTSCTP